MKRNLIILALLYLTLPVYSAVYYVDFNAGNDSDNGLSESSPWKTLSKVNAFAFSPGDQVLFKRDVKWRGALAPISSGTGSLPITFGAYGAGARPIITAAQPLSGTWTNLGDNRWSMPLPTETRTMVFGGV